MDFLKILLALALMLSTVNTGIIPIFAESSYEEGYEELIADYLEEEFTQLDDEEMIESEIPVGYNLELEEFNARTIGSGLVQFELTPIGTLPNGVTFQQARNSLMEVQSVTHELFRTATATASSAVTNGAFGRDALFLGESNGRFHIYYAGFEGWVNAQGATGTINRTINGQVHAIQFRADAVFYPFGTYQSGRGRSLAAFSEEINLMESADQGVPFVPEDWEIAAPGSNNFEALNGGVQVQSVSYYVNRGGILIRVHSGNVAMPHVSAAPWGHTVGPAPSWMAQNQAFYSFDGVFFYTNPRNIRPNGQGAVNADRPHINYFQYLSYRAEAHVTAAQLDNFLLSRLTAAEREISAMTGSGRYFMEAQATHGTNAILSFAKALHESGRGLSSIARNNNNIFGLNAVDSDPAGQANRFAHVRDSIMEHGGHWMSRGYLFPGDWRHAGPHVGHKGSGINVRYASDPYWGEKIAGWAFMIDQHIGGTNHNRETLAILTDTRSVPVQRANGSRMQIETFSNGVPVGAADFSANAGNFRFFPLLIQATIGNNRQIRLDGAVHNQVVSRNSVFSRNTSVGYIPTSTPLAISWGTGGPITPTPPPVQPIIPQRIQVVAASVPLRSGPGANYRAIAGGNVTQQTAVVLIAQSGDWSNIQAGSRTGWVRTARLGTPVPIQRITNAAIPLRRGPGANFASVAGGEIPSHELVFVYGASGEWSNIRIGNRTGWVRTARLAVPPKRIQVLNATVPLRSGPGANHSNGGVEAAQGQPATVIIQSGDWSNIQIGNHIGWVRAARLSTPAATSRQTTSSIPLRRGPGTNFATVAGGEVPANTSVRMYGSSGEWSNIRIGNRTGWVRTERLR